MSRVFLVGAGPGDAELVTLKAARLIAAAEVLLFDSLVDPRILAMANQAAKRVDVSKRCFYHAAAQACIQAELGCPC